MKGAALDCNVSAVSQRPEPRDEATAKKAADSLCNPLKKAMNEAWEHALRLGIEYGYHAAERGEPLSEAIERALRATDVRSGDVSTMSREDVCQTERK